MCYGTSQVMLQRCEVSGLFMALAILTGSLSEGSHDHIEIFAGAMVALAACTVVAERCKFDGWKDGLAGFNGLLVGCAAFTFCAPSVWTWVLMVIAGLLTLPLKRRLDGLFGSSSFTLPFVVGTWAMLAIGIGTGLCNAIAAPPAAVNVDVSAAALVRGLLKGVSQVFLLDSWASGVIIVAALAASGFRMAGYALGGSAAGMLLAFIAGCPTSEIVSGLWGFSPVLTAIAVGGVLPIARGRFLYVTAGILLTFLIQYLSAPLLAIVGLPVLTMPFCVATILCDHLAKRIGG